MADVKICGLTDPAAVDAAVIGGARYLGFAFHPKSPRYVTLETAAALAARARGRAEIVALTVDAGDAALAEIQAALAPDWVQLHGAETPKRTAEAARFAARGAIRALGVARAEDLDAAAAFIGPAAMLMFDAKPPAAAERTGGHGQAFDWGLLAGRRFGAPWFLAGGLTPENVAAAIAASGAALVDVSTGVERAPGLKDPERIARFLHAAGARHAAGAST